MRISFLLFCLIFTCGIHSGAQNKPAPEKLSFTNEYNEQIRFLFSDTAGNLFLRQIRHDNKLAELVAGCTTDLEKVFRVMNWTSLQWKHSGTNTPSKNDAITILNEAKKGNKFRCVEYAIVLTTALSSIGIKARVLALKTKNVETAEYGAGHVLAEVFLKEYGKWVMADAQFNLVPFRNELPLNAVECQKIYAEGNKPSLRNIYGPVKKGTEKLYSGFIPGYLYYFDTSFDTRQGINIDRLKINDKRSLMLVPVGAKNPGYFQRTEKLNNFIYTNSVADFYRNP